MWPTCCVALGSAPALSQSLQLTEVGLMSPTLTDIGRAFDCVCRDQPAHAIVLCCLPVLKGEVICLLGRRWYSGP